MTDRNSPLPTAGDGRNDSTGPTPTPPNERVGVKGNITAEVAAARAKAGAPDYRPTASFRRPDFGAAGLDSSER